MITGKPLWLRGKGLLRSVFCGFGKTLKDILRDCLLCEVNDMRIQCRLLPEPEPLTLKRAFKVAQGIEMAERDTKDLVVAQGHTTVHRLQRAPGKSVTRQTNCYCCRGNMILLLVNM